MNKNPSKEELVSWYIVINNILKSKNNTSPDNWENLEEVRNQLRQYNI